MVGVNDVCYNCTMKNNFLVTVAIIFFIFFHTGCFNVEQSISRKDDMHSYSYILSINKELSKGIGIGIAEIENFFNDLKNDSPEEIQLSKSETDEDIIISMKFNVNDNMDDEDMRNFLPTYSPEYVKFLLMPLSDKMNDFYGNAVIKLLLDESKWVINIDRSITDTVSSVKIVDKYDSGESLDFISTPLFFRIEIPMNLIIYEANDYSHIIIYK